MISYLKKSTQAAYYGNNYFCPICNNNLYKFSKNDLQNCPVCDSTNLERAAILLITAHYRLEQKVLKILMIDCTGILRNLIKRLKELGQSVSIFSYGTMDSQDGNSFNQMLNLSYAKNSFDVVIAPYFLERVYNEKFFCQELQRVLLDDGLLLTAFDLDLGKEVTEDVKAYDKSARFNLLGNPNYFRRYALDFQERLAENHFFVQKSVIKTEILQQCQAFSDLLIVRETADLVKHGQNLELIISEQMQNNKQNRNGTKFYDIFYYYMYISWQFLTKKIVSLLLLKNNLLNMVVLPLYSVMLFLIGWVIFCLIPYLGYPLGMIFMVASVAIIVDFLYNDDILPMKKIIMSIVTFILFSLAIYPAILFFQYSMGYMISAGVHDLYEIKPGTPQEEAIEQQRMFGK